jgi:hypothetical protein
VHQHVLVALEVAEKFADVSLKTVDAGYLAHGHRQVGAAFGLAGLGQSGICGG